MRPVHGDGEDAHHIRAVWVIGDLAKALGLALGAIHAVGHIKPFKRGVALGVDLDLGFPDEGSVGHLTCKSCVRHLGGDGLTVNLRRNQLEPFAVQEELGILRLRIAAKGDAAFDAGLMRIKVKGQRHLIHQIAKWLIVAEIDGLGGGVAHWASWGGTFGLAGS